MRTPFYLDTRVFHRSTLEQVERVEHLTGSHLAANLQNPFVINKNGKYNPYVLASLSLCITIHLCQLVISA